MIIKYFLFFFINNLTLIGLTELTEKEETTLNKLNYLVVLNKYLITCNGGISSNNSNKKSYEEIKTLLFYLRGQLETRITLFFIENFSYITSELNAKYLDNLSEEIVNKIKQIICLINDDGLENLNINEFNENPMLIIYIIIPIIPIDEEEKDNLEYLLTKKKVDMDFINQIYGLFPCNIDQKNLLFHCSQCNKNEIRDILNNMQDDEKKIIFLKHIGRNVIIYRVTTKNISPISTSQLRKIYIKHGFSLLKDPKLINKCFFKMIHNIYCQ